VASTKKPQPETPPDELTFEEAIARLESIVDRVEQGEIGIERALVEYERGVKLVARCKQILSTVEQRIDELAPENDKPGEPG